MIDLRYRRSWVPTLVSIGSAAVASFMFRDTLLAWFTGRPFVSSEGAPVVAHAGPFMLEARLAPDPPRRSDQRLVLSIRDAVGKPVENALLDVTYDMPPMGAMAEMKGGATVTARGSGAYEARFDLPMGGSWALRVGVRAGPRSAWQAFQMTVGTAGLSAATEAGDAPTSSAEDAPPSGEIDHYTCSMHPSVKQAGPGTCPICGMNLVAVTSEQQQQGVVMIDQARRQLIGVRSEPVVEAPMRDSFRAVGHVTYDEASLADVNLKVHGWITKLFVNQTGQRVAKGQTLFTLYSPELYNAEQDFLLGTRSAARASSAETAAAAQAASNRTDLFASASRQRLRLLGLTDDQIDAIARSGKPSEDLAIPSPASGFVIEKNVVDGASVDAGVKLYRIAALTKVWVEADVYESDLAHVRIGQNARVTLDYLPGRAYDAKIAYLYPYLDPATRTGRVRFELANKDLDLRPGMYASVELSTDLGSRVQVPTAAVVYTGPRRLVFVDLGNGRFRPTEVRIGTESNGMYEVLSGLSPGDSVATSGVFLIAAEARITTAARYWDSTSETTGAGASLQEGSMQPAPSAMAPMAAGPPMIARPMATRNGARPAVAAGAALSAGAPPPAPVDYTCPMHPEVHSTTPGQCPKCGIDLEPHRSAP